MANEDSSALGPPDSSGSFLIEGDGERRSEGSLKTGCWPQIRGEREPDLFHAPLQRSHCGCRAVVIFFLRWVVGMLRWSSSVQSSLFSCFSQVHAESLLGDVTLEFGAAT